MMTEFEILPTGEIRRNGAYIGRVQWTDRVAQLDGADIWVRREDEPALANGQEAVFDEVRAVLRADAPDAEKIRVVRKILNGED